MTASEQNESVEALNNWLTLHKAMVLDTSTDDDPLGFLHGLDNQLIQHRQPHYQAQPQHYQPPHYQQHYHPQHQGDVINGDAANETVMFDGFAQWFKHTFYPELHNRVGIRLMDYSLSSSLLANRADPRRVMDKKMDKKTSPKKVPYQKELLHPADLLADDRSTYNDYLRDNGGMMRYGEDDDDASNVVNSQLPGLPPPPLIQVPIFDSSPMSYYNLGNLHSPASIHDLPPLPYPGQSEPNTSPTFNRPRLSPQPKMTPSESFLNLQPPFISVPSLFNPFEGLWSTETETGKKTETDPFFDLSSSSQLSRRPIPPSSEKSEQRDSNRPNSSDTLNKTQNYFSWM